MEPSATVLNMQQGTRSVFISFASELSAAAAISRKDWARGSKVGYFIYFGQSLTGFKTLNLPGMEAPHQTWPRLMAGFKYLLTPSIFGPNPLLSAKKMGPNRSHVARRYFITDLIIIIPRRDSELRILQKVKQQTASASLFFLCSISIIWLTEVLALYFSSYVLDS